jgi:hypothetical protein
MQKEKTLHKCAVKQLPPTLSICAGVGFEKRPARRPKINKKQKDEKYKQQFNR